MPKEKIKIVRIYTFEGTREALESQFRKSWFQAPGQSNTIDAGQGTVTLVAQTEGPVFAADTVRALITKFINFASFETVPSYPEGMDQVDKEELFKELTEFLQQEGIEK